MNILRTKKGDMNWIIIGLVLGLVALIVILSLISKGFHLGDDTTKCGSTLGGECKLKAECNYFITSGTGCATGEVCCTKGLG